MSQIRKLEITLMNMTKWVFNEPTDVKLVYPDNPKDQVKLDVTMGANATSVPFDQIFEVDITPKGTRLRAVNEKGEPYVTNAPAD